MITSVIRKTYLSTKPRAVNAWAPLYAMTLMMILSLIYWQDPSGWGSSLVASPDLVFHQHQYWRLFTSMGVHADIQHFLSNAVFFTGLGFLLRNYFGRLAFPIISVLGGAAIHGLTLLFYTWAYSSQVTLLGASGVVYFMAGFWLSLFVGIERQMSLARRIMSCIGFTLILLAPTSYEPNISYAAHGIGFIVGLLFGLLFFLFHRHLYRKAEVIEWIEPDVLPDYFREYFDPDAELPHQEGFDLKTGS
jgi:rhomboid protease GluP